MEDVSGRVVRGNAGGDTRAVADRGANRGDQGSAAGTAAGSAEETAVAWDDWVLVGRVARPHGVRGHVVVNPETDFVEERFRVGAVLWTRREPGGVASVTVSAARFGGSRPVVALDGCSTIDEAERLVGLELRVPEAELLPLAPGTYYHHQLVGCAVETVSGESVGAVVRVEGGSAGSLLVVTGPRGEVLIPLTEPICQQIDVEARRIRVAPPEGLLDLNVTKRQRT